MGNHPKIIDFLRCELKDGRSRSAFFAHLVALQRFEAASDAESYKCVVEEDRSSIVYFLLTQSETHAARLSALLGAMEHRKFGRLARDVMMRRACRH